jgi:hypothetical protein
VEMLSVKWIVFLGCAAAWTIVFSMFNRPGVRGWRNLGWIACYVVGVLSFCFLPWRSALGTWIAWSVLSGLLYFGYEFASYFQQRREAGASMPKLITLVHALFMWPIMLPEAVEYSLTELGVLKAPDVRERDART